MSTPPAAGPAPAPAPPPAAPPGRPAPPPGAGPAPGGGQAPPADAGGQAAPPTAPPTPAAEGDNVGTGTSASRATARTGQGSLRAGLLREAWTHIGGDRVQGDKIVVQAAGERGVVLRTLDAGTVEAVRHAFQPPPRWEEIQADAWQRRSVVLRGPAGAGKTAAAVRLLLSAGVSTWYLLDSVAELSRLTGPLRLGTGVGLLLDRPGDLGELTGSLLAGLEDLLRRADARLVLIAGPGSGPGAGAAEYVQRVARPGTLRPVLAAHLAHRLGEEDAERVLARDGVAELVADLLDDSAACRDAARLADVLAHEHHGGDLDPDRVRARMDHTGGEGPEDWFEGLGDTALRTQAIALAVLGGLPQEDVAHAATTLLDRFRSDRGVLTASLQHGPVPLRRDPFAQPRRLFAEQLRARTVSAVTEGTYGRLPCTVAEYRDPDYPARVIRHVWSEYGIQRELVDWLAGLVDSPSQQVRGFAGTALGVIATEAFDHMATQVFPRWIQDETAGSLRREAIAYALRVCARDPVLRPGVHALVQSWYLDGGWPFQAAAARAFGLCLGGGDLAGAVQALTRLGTVDRMPVAIAIGDAFADLVEEDVAAHAPTVLRAVAEMVHEPRSRACGHLVFLILADSLVTKGTDGADAPARDRPTLLRLAAEAPPGGEVRRLLGYLWSETIGGELFADEAATVLEGWAARAESDPLLLDDLVRLLVDDVAARSPRVGLLLGRYARGWTERDRFRPLPRSAAVLGGALRPEPRPPGRSGTRPTPRPTAQPVPPAQPGGAR
ncbi:MULTISPECIES: hypothetical protein [unclassified Streptomyces]|uniref:hypothetical protein n=1 Tax=unclassified Streptomyces TaxID=2593676 RepID=UPI0004BE82B5|nr:MULTISPECIES: hypothetical protein [unclassified Streptomyces]